MVFVLLCLLASAVLVFPLAFWLTRRRMAGDWRRAGPRHVAEGLARRNRIAFLLVCAFLVVLALFEALIADFAYSIQDLQDGLVGGFLPGWALWQVGNGSVSWTLYLALALGVFTGLLAGTVAGIRGHRDLDSVGARHVAW